MTTSRVAPTTLTTAETATLGRRVLDEIETVVVGRRRVLELVLLGILGRGHVLLEDVPGTRQDDDGPLLLRGARA